MTSQMNWILWEMIQTWFVAWKYLYLNSMNINKKLEILKHFNYKITKNNIYLKQACI